jgi:hypothetical protein
MLGHIILTSRYNVLVVKVIKIYKIYMKSTETCEIHDLNRGASGNCSANIMDRSKFGGAEHHNGYNCQKYYYNFRFGRWLINRVKNL